MKTHVEGLRILIAAGRELDKSGWIMPALLFCVIAMTVLEWLKVESWLIVCIVIPIMILVIYCAIKYAIRYGQIMKKYKKHEEEMGDK